MYTFEKTTVLVWQSLFNAGFLQRQSMILRKVLYALINDSCMTINLYSVSKWQGK